MSEGIAVEERPEVEDGGMPEAPSCRHHWIIASPNGSPTSRGMCNRCGEVREFPTALADTVWDSEVFGSGRQHALGGGRHGRGAVRAGA